MIVEISYWITYVCLKFQVLFLQKALLGGKWMIFAKKTMCTDAMCVGIACSLLNQTWQIFAILEGTRNNYY